MENKLDLFKQAKIQGITMGAVGMVLGIIYAFGGAVYDLYTEGSLNAGSALAFLALIGMPVIFASIGFLAAIIGGFIYNSLR